MTIVKIVMNRMYRGLFIQPTHFLLRTYNVPVTRDNAMNNMRDSLLSHGILDLAMERAFKNYTDEQKHRETEKH